MRVGPVLRKGRTLTTTLPQKQARVATRDSERSRAAILDAATVEFTTHGYGGASVNEVAARASINKRMIYHYFGSKEGLWLAVLEATYQKIRDAERELELSHLSPHEAMRRLVLFTFDYFLANPEFISLLNTENMLRARHLHGSTQVRRIHSPHVASLRDLLARGAATGDFRVDVDPVQIYISIAALSYFYFSNQHTLGVIFQRDLMGASELELRRAHVADMIMEYLAARDRHG